MTEKETATEKTETKEQPEMTVSMQELHDNLEKMILDTSMNKYEVVLFGRRWAHELQSKESAMGAKSVQDIIAHSLTDVLGEKVSAKTIRNLPPIRLVKKPKTGLALESFAKAALDNPPESESEKAKPGS